MESIVGVIFAWVMVGCLVYPLILLINSCVELWIQYVTDKKHGHATILRKVHNKWIRYSVIDSEREITHAPGWDTNKYVSYLRQNNLAGLPRILFWGTPVVSFLSVIFFTTTRAEDDIVYTSDQLIEFATYHVYYVIGSYIAYPLLIIVAFTAITLGSKFIYKLSEKIQKVMDKVGEE